MIPARGALPNPRPDAGVVIREPSYAVPAWAAEALSRQPEMQQLRRRLRAADIDLYRVLVALAEFGLNHGPVSTCGQPPAPSTATATPSGWLSTTQAADRLGVSPRTVRRLVAEGLLCATRPGYGHLIDAEEVDRLRDQRAVA